eukprot:9724777-Lingulodinium_polyedra.AAC.1
MKEAKVYEVDHLQKFEEVGEPWPPTFSPAFKAKVGHMPRRMAEIIFFHEVSTIPSLQEPGASFFCDANYSIGWSRVAVERTPCLVGSSRIWCFGRQAGMQESAGIELAGEEALNLQGFSLSKQNAEWIENH